jgi:hypothetical protein
VRIHPHRAAQKDPTVASIPWLNPVGVFHTASWQSYWGELQGPTVGNADFHGVPPFLSSFLLCPRLCFWLNLGFFFFFFFFFLLEQLLKFCLGDLP